MSYQYYITIIVIILAACPVSHGDWSTNIADINKRIARPRMISMFNSMILDMLGKMMEENFCFIIHDFLKKRLVDYKKFRLKLPKNISRRKDKCKLKKSYKFDRDFIDPDRNVEIFNFTAHVYNYLPLLVQCQVLIESTANYDTMFEKSNKNVFKREYILDAFREKTPSKLKEFFGNASMRISAFERIILENTDDIIMNSSYQCSKLLLGEKAYSKSLWYYIKREEHIPYAYECENIIRRNTPALVREFGDAVGIRHVSPLPSFMSFGQHERYYLEIMSFNESRDFFVYLAEFIPFYIFGKPIDSNFVLSAHYNLGREYFKKNFHFDLRFYADVGKLHRGPFDFPEHLTDYFRASDLTRQCLYIHIASAYQQIPKKDIIDIYVDYDLVTTDLSVCLYNSSLIFDKKNHEKRVPGNDNHFITVKNRNTKSGNAKTNNMKTSSEMSRLSNMEIIMVAALSLVFILSTLFFTVCAVYVRRRRRQRGHVIRIIPTPSTDTDLQPRDISTHYASVNTYKKQKKIDNNISYIQDDNGDEIPLQKSSKRSLLASRSSSNSPTTNSPRESQISSSSSFERTLLRNQNSSSSINRPLNLADISNYNSNIKEPIYIDVHKENTEGTNNIHIYSNDIIDNNPSSCHIDMEKRTDQMNSTSECQKSNDVIEKPKFMDTAVSTDDSPSKFALVHEKETYL